MRGLILFLFLYNHARLVHGEQRNFLREVHNNTALQNNTDTFYFENYEHKCKDEAVIHGSVKERKKTHEEYIELVLKRALKDIVCHATNGDEEKFGYDSEFPFIGNFHKTLPSNDYGEVDRDAYKYLVKECIATGDIDACQATPGEGVLMNPVAGSYIPTIGQPTWNVATDPAPSVTSAELALQYAELAWQALMRDVPFNEYSNNELALEAAKDIANMSGFQKYMNNKYWRPYLSLKNKHIAIDPQTQLFRMSISGVTKGPFVSQLLLHPFTYDGIPVEPKMTTYKPGVEYMTTVDDWLLVQRGGRPDGPRHQLDDTPRYIRTARDLGKLASSDFITSVYFRAVTVLFSAGVFPRTVYGVGFRGERVIGFSTAGIARLVHQIHSVVMAEAHAFFNKWNVHRLLRPEAFGGRVHFRAIGARNYPIDESILDSEALKRLMEKFGTGLLPMLNSRGGPTHPSYPSGHAISAGACVTVLKVWFDPEDTICWPGDVLYSPDGDKLEKYESPEGESCLTVSGELNKVAQNISVGRDMSGIHWRADNVSGMLLGEAVAMHILQDELDSQPECGQIYKYRSFEGHFIELKKTNCDEPSKKHSKKHQHPQTNVFDIQNEMGPFDDDFLNGWNG